MNIKDLRNRCQPIYKKDIDPLMEWTILRPLSIYFTWVFVRLSLKAEHVSFMGLFLAIGGSVLLLTGQVHWGIAGASLIWLSFLLDCVDGEVARYYNSSSIRGTYLDYFVGGVNDMAILLGIGFYVSKVTGWPELLIVYISVMLGFIEKIISLYSHSLVYRNVQYFWEEIKVDTVQDYDKKVWFKLTTFERLIRVPFETFFRVTVILFAFIIDGILQTNAAVPAVWLGIQIFGWVLVIKSFYSEYFDGRVEKNMNDFVGALKSRAKRN